MIIVLSSQVGIEGRDVAKAIISARVDERSGTALLLCAIDNLVKGAAGQAIQNLNLARGWAEDAGLPSAFEGEGATG